MYGLRHACVQSECQRDFGIDRLVAWISAPLCRCIVGEVRGVSRHVEYRPRQRLRVVCGSPRRSCQARTDYQLAPHDGQRSDVVN